MTNHLISIVTSVWAVVAPSIAQAQPDELPRHGAVWVEPVWPVAMAAAGNLYVSGGVNLAATSTTSVVLEAAYTSNTNWYGCGSRSSGFWLGAGWAFGSAQGGFFWAPKLRYRRFETQAPDATAAPGFSGCSDGTVSGLPGVDQEVGGAVDVGYRFRTGRTYVAVVAGAGVGICVDCPGNLQTGAVLSSSRRTTQPAFYVNPNLIRVGFSF